MNGGGSGEARRENELMLVDIRRLNLIRKKPDLNEKERCLLKFLEWGVPEQVLFVKKLLVLMCQRGSVQSFATSMLNRDFISMLSAYYLEHIAEKILCYLDPQSLTAAESVCDEWTTIMTRGMLWKKFIEDKVKTNRAWRKLIERGRYLQYFDRRQLAEKRHPNDFYRSICTNILNNMRNVDDNWRNGRYTYRRISCQSGRIRGVYSIHYDDVKIISGQRDGTIKIWNINNFEHIRTLKGHTAAVLSVQFNSKIIISGSMDQTVRIWDIISGSILNTLTHHADSVLGIQFAKGILVTASKDSTVAVWHMKSPTNITMFNTLVGHVSAINAVGFDEKYIVSASADCTIIVWCTKTCELVHTLRGHQCSITCMQYRGRLIISGSTDSTIRLWDIETAYCLHILIGHGDIVRSLRFNSKFLISGDCTGIIKIWDVAATIKRPIRSKPICLNTHYVHADRVYSIRMDDLKFVSCSQDDSILIWDFSNIDTLELTDETTLPLI